MSRKTTSNQEEGVRFVNPTSLVSRKETMLISIGKGINPFNTVKSSVKSGGGRLSELITHEPDSKVKMRK